ncbi:hypothetical protein D3C81_1500770 [compost metagenome]
MFGHFGAARRRHKGAGGGDINTVGAVAAGADDIGKRVIRARERQGIGQQRFGCTGDLFRVFAADLHADQCGGQLAWLQFTAHDGAE